MLPHLPEWAGFLDDRNQLVDFLRSLPLWECECERVHATHDTHVWCVDDVFAASFQKARECLPGLRHPLREVWVERLQCDRDAEWTLYNLQEAILGSSKRAAAFTDDHMMVGVLPTTILEDGGLTQHASI